MAIVMIGATPTHLTTTSATTVQAGSTTLDTVVLTIEVANYSTSTVTLSLSEATSTTVSDATAICKTIPVPPLSKITIKGPRVIKAAGTAVNINAQAGTANALTVKVSGYTTS